MISVIVPAYNVEKTIKRTLDSILAQTYFNLEIIVVNDGSSDCTGKIIEQYAEKYSKCIKTIHTRNNGVTSARLKGVEVAKGEWIGFVDGDDEIESDMYERLFSNAVNYRAEISHCGYQMVFADGRVHYFYNTGRLIQQDKITGVKDLLEGTFVEPGLCNKLFHKNLFYSLLYEDVMDKSIKINEDLLMNYYLFARASKSVFEDVCKYHYIVRNTSVTRTLLNKNQIYDPIKVKRIIFDTATEDFKTEASRAYISTCVNVYNNLMLAPINQFIPDEANIRENIVAHKCFIHLLGKKRRILAYLILYIPRIYKPLYRFYAKYLLKSKYN